MAGDKKKAVKVCLICGKKFDDDDLETRETAYQNHFYEHREDEELDWFGL